MKKMFSASLGGILLSFIVFSAVFAQTGQLTLTISRDWGYGGFNGDIEGVFSMRITGMGNLARVEYYIDEARIGQITQPPFNLQFSTDNYPLGNHRLYAIGYSSSGQQYRSNVISANFVPKQSSMKSILPLLGVYLLVILVATLIPFLVNRGRRISLPLGTKRNYGAGGGGICPNCHRPFAISLFSIHLGFSKLAACPYCGKWSLVRVESIEKLREAEKAELENAMSERQPEISEEEKLHKEIEDSKYQSS